jgi:hypothetical protein
MPSMQVVASLLEAKVEQPNYIEGEVHASYKGLDLEAGVRFGF